MSVSCNRCKVAYSGNLSRVKTFANFTVSGQFVKIFSAKIFIEYGSIIINGRVIVVSPNSQKFGLQKFDFQQFEKVFTRAILCDFQFCFVPMFVMSSSLILDKFYREILVICFLWVCWGVGLKHSLLYLPHFPLVP